MLKGNKVVLREKRLEDAPEDYAWKTDDELCRLDAAFPLQIPYARYLMDYAEELRYPDSIRRRFAIETLDGKHVGNCSYYDINEYRGEAELGIMVGDREYWDKGYGSDAVATLLNHIFRETKLNRIYLHTLEWNIRAQKCFEKCGFVPHGHSTRGWHNFIVMEIQRSQWQKRNTAFTEAATT